MFHYVCNSLKFETIWTIVHVVIRDYYFIRSLIAYRGQEIVRNIEAVSVVMLALYWYCVPVLLAKIVFSTAQCSKYPIERDYVNVSELNQTSQLTIITELMD